MFTLLHLLAAISLLIWGTYIVRTGIMRVYGARLRQVLCHSIEKKTLAFISGICVTALIQSSNATALLVTSFVSQKLVTLASALVIILGADVGTALMARILTFNLSWLSPLLIFIGVNVFLAYKQTRTGQIGKICIGLGLILLALELIVSISAPITKENNIKILFASLTDDIILNVLIGAFFAVLCYSSLTIVLLTSVLTTTNVISLKVALCLTIGSNIGTGVLAFCNNWNQNSESKRVAFGNMLFKFIGCLIILPFISLIANSLKCLPLLTSELVIYFHIFYTFSRCLIMIPFTNSIACLCNKLITDIPKNNNTIMVRPRYLDISVLDTPTLALVNAARETLRMGDVIENMLLLYTDVLHGYIEKNREVCRLDDNVDILYTAIKLYLAQMPKEDLDEKDSLRWAEIIEMALNLEQAGDIIERMTGDIIANSLNTHKNFSEQGIKELDVLYEQLISNLCLSLAVFISNDLNSARKLRRAKHRFRITNRRYAHAHVDRLHQQNLQSMETSSLHLSLLGDLKRVNSLFCSVAYNVLKLSEVAEEETYEDRHNSPSKIKK